MYSFKHASQSKNNIGDNSRSIGGEVHSDGDFLLFEGNRYSRRGFLYKGFPLSSVVSNYSVLLECSYSLLIGHLAASCIHSVVHLVFSIVKN